MAIGGVIHHPPEAFKVAVSMLQGEDRPSLWRFSGRGNMESPINMPVGISGNSSSTVPYADSPIHGLSGNHCEMDAGGGIHR